MAQRERERDHRVEVGARDRPHEQDDRHHREPGRDHGRGEAYLSLGVKDPASGGGQHQQERPQRLGEQPPVGEPRVLELGPRAELEREQMERSGAVVIGEAR